MRQGRPRVLFAAGLAALLSALLLAGLPAAAQSDRDNDRIPRFAADVVIQDSGDLLVTEEIDFLVAEGSFKHGIYRDFPISYLTTLGLTEKVGFDLLEVQRDGQAEPYVVESYTAGVRIRVGAADVLLKEGVHRYRLVYRTDRQLIFHADFDEIYWNVTGNDWAHPIDRAEATIHLPGGAAPVEIDGYTGYADEDGKDFTQSRAADGSVTFAATRTLAPGEGLTVAVSWPKGIVAEPGFAERLSNGLADNLGLLIGLAGLAATVGYFYAKWLKVGRDPEKGIVIPLFEAPDDLSPAATGTIWAKARGDSMGRSLAFTVALTSLAIKNRLTIEEDGKSFILRTATTPITGAKLPPGETAVMAALFPDGVGETAIEPSYTAAIDAAVDELNGVLAREHSDAFFRHNYRFWVFGTLLAVASLLAAFVLQSGDPESLVFVIFAGVFGLAFSVPIVIIGRNLLGPWRALLQGRSRQPVGTLLGTLFVLLFALIPLGVLSLGYAFYGPAMLLLICTQAATIVLFWNLMKAPTRLGREMLDRIEGYRLYLSVAEADRMNMLTAEPEMTLDLFEYHLPYAMALGVEEAWTERFTAGASAAVVQAAERQPRWYVSHSGRHGIAAVASGLSSGLSRTLTSAATRPSR